MLSFWKSLVLISFFFVLAPITLAISLFSLLMLSDSTTISVTPEKKVVAANLIKEPKSGVSVYASFPAYQPSISDAIGSADARAEIIKQYLKEYDSPLIPYANKIVETADKYKLDYRLITAIAQQESNLCHIIPPESYNCWGWGITGESSLGFKSFDDGIETVSRGLRENYLNNGLSSIEDIMKVYTPQSNGSWAHGVNTFMADMQ